MTDEAARNARDHPFLIVWAIALIDRASFKKREIPKSAIQIALAR